MALGEKFWNKKEGYPSVVSQNEITGIFKIIDILLKYSSILTLRFQAP